MRRRWVEAVAMVPQIVLLRKTGGTQPFVCVYIAGMGLYRLLYIVNWIYRGSALSAELRIMWAAGGTQFGLLVLSLAYVVVMQVRLPSRAEPSLLVRLHEVEGRFVSPKPERLGYFPSGTDPAFRANLIARLQRGQRHRRGPDGHGLHDVPRSPSRSRVQRHVD